MIPIVLYLVNEYIEREANRNLKVRGGRGKYRFQRVVADSIRSIFPLKYDGDHEETGCFIRGTFVFQDEGKQLFKLIKSQGDGMLVSHDEQFFTTKVSNAVRSAMKFLFDKDSDDNMKDIAGGTLEENYFFIILPGYFSSCKRNGEIYNYPTQVMYVHTHKITKEEGMQDLDQDHYMNVSKVLDSNPEFKIFKHGQRTYITFFTLKDGKIDFPRPGPFPSKLLNKGGIYDYGRTQDQQRYVKDTLFILREIDKKIPKEEKLQGAFYQVPNLDFYNKDLLDLLSLDTKSTNIHVPLAHRKLASLTSRILLNRKGGEYYVPQEGTDKVIYRILSKSQLPDAILSRDQAIAKKGDLAEYVKIANDVAKTLAVKTEPPKKKTPASRARVTVSVPSNR